MVGSVIAVIVYWRQSFNKQTHLRDHCWVFCLALAGQVWLSEPRGICHLLPSSAFCPCSDPSPLQHPYPQSEDAGCSSSAGVEGEGALCL